MEATFTINGREYKANSAIVPIDTTLNTFIRTHAKLTGTKFMCLEGGCGVCIVTLTGRHPVSGEERSWAVNSCLWFVYSCHGLRVTTIEGIGNKRSGYHPVQTALYEFNGTQCGYCSPGMVMNMYSLLEANDGKVSTVDVENSFGGNICRCTGYRPILDAFKSLASENLPEDIEDLTLKCSALKMSGKCGQQLNQRRCKPLDIVFADNRQWISVETLQNLLDVLKSNESDVPYMLVSGDTAHGVFRRPEELQVFIDVNRVAELHAHTMTQNELVIGANVNLTETMRLLQQAANDNTAFKYCVDVAKHIDLVANVPVRNTGSIAGNLSIKHAHREFPSDIYLLLETVNAKLVILNFDGKSSTVSPMEYLNLDMKGKVIHKVILPALAADSFVFRSYKTMVRAQNAHAYVNAGFLFEFNNSGGQRSIVSCRVCFGGINPSFTHAIGTETAMTGSNDLYTNDGLQRAISALQKDLLPDWVLPDASPVYRKNLAVALFYRFVLSTIPSPDQLKSDVRSASEPLQRGLSSGSQSYGTVPPEWPLTKAIPKYEGRIQTSGEATYVNDIQSGRSERELWAAFVVATAIGSKIVKIDPSEALNLPGVHSFYSAKDIPGKNSFIPPQFKVLAYLEDEEIFVGLNSEVKFFSQPCGIILAERMDLANYAATKVKISYGKIGRSEASSSIMNSFLDSMSFYSAESEPKILPTLKDVLEANDSSRINNIPFSNDSQGSETTKSNDQQGYQALSTIRGRFEIGSQYHYTMETQSTVCIPAEDGGIDVYSSTQWMDLTQVAISEALKMPQNAINMVVRRLGGGYGAKISRGSQIACACALACLLTQRPIRFVMTIESNMMTIGKRFACSNDYTVVADSQTGKINALTNSFVEDAGCSINEAFVTVTAEAMHNAYDPNPSWLIQPGVARTDAPSNTWCRAPAHLEGISMIENIMEHIARVVGKDASDVRLANINNDNPMKKIYMDFVRGVDFKSRKAEICEFNKNNRWRKRGIATSIMQYGIVYFGAFPAYVAIHHADGSVVVSHGGIECGQGVNTKVAQVAAYALGISIDFISVKASDTVIGINAFVTGGSVGSESICFAAKRACEMILERMMPVRKSLPKDADWPVITEACHSAGIDLTARYEFKPSDAKPYTVYGCACAEIELDVLTGNLLINRVDIVEDTGDSISPLVDVGQVEGAFIMGVGYWLSEELVYNRQSGELLTNRTWNYKPPGAKDIPIDFRISFPKNNPNARAGVLRSKATGEPALCLAISVPFALRHALDSVRKDSGSKDVWYQMGTALTPETLFLLAKTEPTDFKLN